MEYKCSICGENVGKDLLSFIDHTDNHVIDEIKKGHPEWVAEDGVCQPCLEYYKKQLKGDD